MGFHLSTTPLWVRISATVLVLVFVGIYVETMYRTYFGRSSWIADVPNRERWMIRAPLLAIATMLVFLPVPGSFSGNPFATVMMFVVIAWTLTSPPDRAFSAVIISTGITAAILAIAFGGGAVLEISVYSLAFGFFTSGYVINRGLITELRLEQSRVRDQAVTEERFRLARDLHDTVGHSMTQITLKAELARRLLPDNRARAVDELQQIEQLSRTLSAEVRRSIAGEVALSLHQEIERATELLGSMEIDVTVNGDDENMPDHISDIFAWCLREGVMNVVRHSGASRCEITLTPINDQFILKITDNGSNPVNDEHKGQGMAGMTQRLETLDGEVEFRVTDSGHVLTIRIPV